MLVFWKSTMMSVCGLPACEFQLISPQVKGQNAVWIIIIIREAEISEETLEQKNNWKIWVVDGRKYNTSWKYKFINMIYGHGLACRGWTCLYVYHHVFRLWSCGTLFASSQLTNSCYCLIYGRNYNILILNVLSLMGAKPK